MTNPSTPNLPPRVAAGLAASATAYHAIYDLHGERDLTTCKCGRGFNRRAGLGSHLAAVRRAAAVASEVARDAALREYDAR